MDLSRTGIRIFGPDDQLKKRGNRPRTEYLRITRVGTRRRIHGFNAWRPATGSFCVCLLYLFDRRHREVMLQQRESSIGRSESPS